MPVYPHDISSYHQRLYTYLVARNMERGQRPELARATARAEAQERAQRLLSMAPIADTYEACDHPAPPPRKKKTPRRRPDEDGKP